MMTLTKHLSSTLQITPMEVDALLSALSITFRDNAVAHNTIAIPGFGNFCPVKHEETIVQDEHTPGKLTLMPPAITLDFTPGAMLKKQLKNG